MLILDIIGQEINIGDNVIINDGNGTYKCKLIGETKLSVKYIVYTNMLGAYNKDLFYWVRKNSHNFRNMYKI